MERIGRLSNGDLEDGGYSFDGKESEGWRSTRLRSSLPTIGRSSSMPNLCQAVESEGEKDEHYLPSYLNQMKRKKSLFCLTKMWWNVMNKITQSNDRATPEPSGVKTVSRTVDKNSKRKKVYRVGEAVLASKLGCSKDDTRKILYAGSKIRLKFLDLESAEEALKWMDERDRISLDSRHSDSASKMKELIGTSTS